MWFFSLAKGLYFLVGKLRWAVWGRGEGRLRYARERDSLPPRAVPVPVAVRLVA
jgi:hypothetical protein